MTFTKAIEILSSDETRKLLAEREAARLAGLTPFQRSCVYAERRFLKWLGYSILFYFGFALSYAMAAQAAGDKTPTSQHDAGILLLAGAALSFVYNAVDSLLSGNSAEVAPSSNSSAPDSARGTPDGVKCAAPPKPSLNDLAASVLAGETAHLEGEWGVGTDDDRVRGTRYCWLKKPGSGQNWIPLEIGFFIYRDRTIDGPVVLGGWNAGHEKDYPVIRVDNNEPVMGTLIGSKAQQLISQLQSGSVARFACWIARKGEGRGETNLAGFGEAYRLLLMVVEGYSKSTELTMH